MSFTAFQFQFAMRGSILSLTLSLCGNIPAQDGLVKWAVLVVPESEDSPGCVQVAAVADSAALPS